MSVGVPLELWDVRGTGCWHTRVVQSAVTAGRTPTPAAAFPAALERDHHPEIR
jgi:hypothetical protein